MFLQNDCGALISVLMPIYNPDPAFLEEALKSVLAQTYQKWELCLADDASNNPAVIALLKKYSYQDKRIKIHLRDINGHISEASNSALNLATGGFIALMDHDDLLPSNSLKEVAEVILKQPSVRLIYSDEDKINKTGKHHDPYFKPSWNRDLFYSQNFISHLGVYHAETVRKIGGFQKGLEGSQDHDLTLRFIEQIDDDQIHHIPKVLYHWRSHEQSTASTRDAKPYAIAAGERAINDHHQRIGSLGICTHDKMGGYRVRYPIPNPKNKIKLSTIILSDGNPSILSQSLEQLQRIHDEFSLEILILPITPQSYLKISKIEMPQGISLSHRQPGESLALAINKTTNNAVGDLIWFFNDYLNGIDREDLEELISHAVRPDIGAVGGLLLHPDGWVRQAGLLLDHHRISVAAFRNLNGNSRGCMGRSTLIQNYSAVSMNCMIIEKQKFLEVGGVDCNHLDSHYLDVDLCLRLMEAGYRTLWTPYAKCMDRSPRYSLRGISDRFSQGFVQDRDYMKNRWGDILKNDPAYNPNLNQRKKDFSFKWPPKENESSTH